ncbi:MAG: toll/interleukin-1 receptor domain-containing protein [Burkholderiaceae bacterium]|nr:toll/interleukin-1 receptor domain-containing protein [Burkholderiaceae bacterium]
MATIYVSYKYEDAPIVRALVPLLQSKGHRIRSDQELPIGAAWRDQLMGSMLASDVVLLIWTENTARSQHVPAEVGVVRATPRLALLPVLVGDVAIPPFIQDLIADRIPDTSDDTLQRLGERLDASIRKHLDYRTLGTRGRPKIFISHRHKDEDIVRALLDCLERHFEIQRQDIRCTSVRPYRLPVGENTADRLRAEITDAEVVLGILTTDTLASSYVAFELGSAWGQRVWTCPLLAGGADQSHIPDPIRGTSPLFLSKEGDCHQLLGDLEGFTSLARRSDLDRRELDDRVRRLAKAASGTPGAAATAAPG